MSQTVQSDTDILDSVRQALEWNCNKRNNYHCPLDLKVTDEIANGPALVAQPKGDPTSGGYAAVARHLITDERIHVSSIDPNSGRIVARVL